MWVEDEAQEGSVKLAVNTLQLKRRFAGTVRATLNNICLRHGNDT